MPTQATGIAISTLPTSVTAGISIAGQPDFPDTKNLTSATSLRRNPTARTGRAPALTLDEHWNQVNREIRQRLEEFSEQLFEYFAWFAVGDLAAITMQPVRG